uniref:Major facilitator superfamily domain containing 4Aa n=1 Tax=Paramormyrops kingsleyae TaxID=1676925 RepID=A0A3B3R402_9TELE
MAIAGLAMGVIDTIANIQLVKIYQKDSAIFLQALHFFIGFGALVSPLIADPFLSETNCVVSNGTGNTTAMMEHLRNTLAGGPMPNISQYQLPVEGKVITQVSFAFWIMALINLPVPIAVFMLMFREKLIPCCASGIPRLLDRDELAIETRHENDFLKGSGCAGHSDPFCCCQNNSLRGLPPSFFGIHILGGMVLFMTDGIVGAYAGFVYTYAVAPPMSLAHRTAGYLASVFWAAITVGRLVCIPLSYRFQPVRLLLINLVMFCLIFTMFYLSLLNCAKRPSVAIPDSFIAFVILLALTRMVVCTLFSGIFHYFHLSILLKRLQIAVLIVVSSRKCFQIVTLLLDIFMLSLLQRVSK